MSLSVLQGLMADSRRVGVGEVGWGAWCHSASIHKWKCLRSTKPGLDLYAGWLTGAGTGLITDDWKSIAAGWKQEVSFSWFCDVHHLGHKLHEGVQHIHRLGLGLGLAKYTNQSALLIEVEGCFQLTWPGWQQLWTSCCQTVMLAGRSPSVVYQPERTKIQ